MSDNTQTSASQDISSGARTGAKIANTAKNTAKAVGKAASGNYVGAAVDVLRDESWRQVIAIILVITFFALFVLIFVFPMSIYEAVKSFLEDLSDTWAENYYGGTHGRFISFFIAIGKTVADIFKGAWETIKSATTGDGDTDTYEDMEMNIVADDQEMIKVYKRKIVAAKDKVTARQKQIADILARDAKSGQIYSYFLNRFYSEFGDKGKRVYSGVDELGYPVIESETRYVYEGVTTVINTRTLKDKNALALLCLHTVQEGGDIGNIRLSAFMKWLGYSGNRGKWIQFPLGKNEDFVYSIKSWTGTFMPQYLEDENAERIAKQKMSVATEPTIEKDDYNKKYGAPLVDMLIKVECSILSNIRASRTEAIYTETDYRWDIVDWIPIFEDENGGWYWGYEYADRDDMRLVGWDPVYDRVPYDYQVTEIHVKYTLPISITCRDVTKILSVTGLWQGLLPREKAIMDAITSSQKAGEAA